MEDWTNIISHKGISHERVASLFVLRGLEVGK